MKSISYKTLESIDWPEDVFIEGGILSRGDTMLIGAESKGGKSTFIAGLIRQMITGGNFLGFKVTKPLKVFYMQAELRERRLKERLFPTYEKIDDDMKSNLYIWSTQGLVTFDKSQIPEIEAEIMIIRPDVLIIDPMLNFHNFNENDSQQMAVFFRQLDALKSQFDMAIIMAHHFRKAPQEESKHMNLLECIRGSSALRGWAVTTIAMEGRGESEYRELAFDLRNSDEPIKRTIRYNPKTKDFDWHDPITNISQWAIEYLEKCNGKAPSSNKFIDDMMATHGDILGNNRTKAFSIKNSLSNTNVIKTIKDGKIKRVARF